MKKIGLALGSGGARGFSHIGVIKVLLENNIPIHCIAGTSMGALIGGYFALTGNVDLMEDLAINFKKRDILNFVDLNDPRISLIKGLKVKKFLKKYFKNSSFKDTKIPLNVGVTRLDDGASIVIKKGNLLESIFASGSFPGVFPPVKIRNKYYIDGGAVNATPVNIAKEMGADVIIAVDLFGLTSIKNKKVDSGLVMARVYDLLANSLNRYDEKDSNLVVLKPIKLTRMKTFSFHNGKKYILAGMKEAKSNLKKIKKLIR